MTRVEAPHITTERFFKSWDDPNVHPQRRIAELISTHKETHRLPDVYHFNVTDGQLIDPETGQPILDFIAVGAERQIAEKLQDWAAENDEGNAYWISPQLDGVYPCNKIIIHEIAYTEDNQKVVINTAILFDEKLEKPEELRDQFFETDDQGIHDVISWIESFTGKKIAGSTYTQSERLQAEVYANQLVLGVPYEIIIEQMQRDNFIGQSPISCPTRIMNLSFSNSIMQNANIINLSAKSEVEDQYGSLHFDCPRCSKTNTRPYGKLISNCQHCNGDVTC